MSIPPVPFDPKNVTTTHVPPPCPKHPGRLTLVYPCDRPGEHPWHHWHMADDEAGCNYCSGMIL